MAASFANDAVDQAIPAAFARSAVEHANFPAVRFDTHEITYADLEERSASVAAWLLAAVGHEPRAVGLLLPQGIELIVATLGVLRAGHWYVPFDTAASSEGLASGIAFAEAPVLITSERTHELAVTACGSACRAARVNDCRAIAGRLPDVAPDALAYVYFTSGTTGRPKGVMDSHRNVLHNIRRYTTTLGITEADRLTLLQAATFSGSVSNVLGALLNGGTLLMYDATHEGIGAPLARWIEREGPTIYHSVPTIFRSICTGGHVFPTVRVVRLEGDSAAPGDVDLFRAHFPHDAILVNGLGTTETGICRQFFVRPETHITGNVLPVGYAVPDMDARVIDEEGHDVPAWQLGQIAVRSRYLALGYWRDELRTDAMFRGSGDAREYRTGDLGRMRSDGCLEHLGRRDERLKLAGVWVDVPAIEAALRELPAVKEAAVVLETTTAGDPVLAAYIVPAGEAPSYDALRSALEGRVAPHELPARGWSIPHLPVTAHGKVDRSALNPASATRLKHEDGQVAPRSRTEKVVAEIWKDVLGLRHVGVRQRFVQLGGTSLQATHVAMEVEERLGRHVSLTALMEAQTIEELVRVIESSDPAVRTSSLVSVQPHGRSRPLFCVHDLESDPFLFAHLARRLGDDQPVYGLRHPGDWRLDEVPQSLESLAALYIQELQTRQPHGPYRLAGFCYGGVVALAMARALRNAGEEVELLTLFNVTPHDLFALVSPRAQRRFRRDLPARVRYVLAKPDAPLWAWRKLSRRIADVAWRARLPWADRFTPGDETPSSEHVRARLLRAFESFEPPPHQGRTLLFVAGETLGLYSDAAEEAWAGLSTGPLDVQVSPRDGYRMLVEPDVAAVAARLRETLEELDS